MTPTERVQVGSGYHHPADTGELRGARDWRLRPNLTSCRREIDGVGMHSTLNSTG